MLEGLFVDISSVFDVMGMSDVLCGYFWFMVMLIVEFFLLGLLLVSFVECYFDVIVMDEEFDIVECGFDVGIWLG